jgi:broad specificity phosphatase PhoE
MEVTFLRHAQSIFNRDLTSKKDCELTDYGIEQAKQIKGTYDIIICSILKRAKQTLQYSELNSKKLYFTDLCREVRRDICDFFEGEDESNLESDEELQKRMKLFKEFLRSKTNPGERVLVICHRDFIHEISQKKCPVPQNAGIQTLLI